jgi:hypothetical protein
MSVTSLVTDGFICYRGQPIPVPQPASLDMPDVTGAVEVRPKIRRVTPPDDVGQPKPSVISAQELRPKVEGEAQPGPTPSTPPKTTSVQELKPKIVKAEEED